MVRLHLRLTAAVLLMAGALGGCADNRPVNAPAAVQPVHEEEEYIIGPGDVLKIVVVHNTDLSTDAPVRPDGRISVPLIKDIDAVGKTPSQLAHDVEVALQTYVRAPTVNVIVSQARSAFSQIRVVGQGVTPRALPYRSGMRVLDVVVEAGGLTQYAAGNRAQIVRTVDGTTSRIKVRLDDLLNRGDTSQNAVMQPGDILVIPEARF